MIFTQKNTLIDINVLDLSKLVGLSYNTTSILVNRGYNTKEKIEKFLNPTEKDLIDPFLLDNMNKVVAKILDAVEKRKRILIFGDYDVDGISAVAILYKYFEKKNLKVDYFLPNRYEDGYGLTMETAEKVIELFNPELIITVDCGISCYKEIDYLLSKGIDVIVTDHHEIPEILPNTLTLNAKIPNQKFGFTELCGAGLAFKIVQALGENIYEYLPIAAIATVADIVSLTEENRAIVVLGLKHINNLPQGVKLLLKELKISNLTSGDIAFKVAPKLNAAGRMGDASIALQLFINNNKSVLFETLIKLTAMNIERQQLCNKVYEDVIEKLGSINSNKQRCIILQSKDWDSGLLGIVCARLIEEYNKPAFLFTNDNGVLKGSVRSINGINIHTVLSSCSSLLETFGGHSMAAGLSLNLENYEEFKKEINDYFNNNFTEEDFIYKKYYDLKLETKDINLTFVKELEKLEPFGCENPKPVFMISWEKSVVKPMNNFPQHLNIILNNNVNLIAFNASSYIQNIQYNKTKNALIELQTNSFKGKESVKCLVKNFMFENYNKISQDMLNGNYIRQIFSKTFFDGYINYCDDIFSKISECLNASNYGTLIICNSNKNIEKLEEIIKNYNINYCVGKVNNKNSTNTIVVGLNCFENVLNYNNVIFTEPVIVKEYFSNFKAKIYVPKGERFNFSELKLSLSREYLLSVFAAIKEQSGKINVENEYSYYFELKRVSPHIINFDYAKFVASINIFEELELISIDKNILYEIKVVDGVKTQLENSSYYNKLKHLSKLGN